MLDFYRARCAAPPRPEAVQVLRAEWRPPGDVPEPANPPEMPPEEPPRRPVPPPPEEPPEPGEVPPPAPPECRRSWKQPDGRE